MSAAHDASQPIKRLRRLLLMVPWIMERPGISHDAICEEFGVTKSQLVADLDLIFVCGLPPYTPDMLMVVDAAEDGVSISSADFLKRPMRPTPREALALAAAGRAALQLPGVGESEHLRRAVRKLEAILAPSGLSAPPVDVDLEEPAGPELELLESAVTGRRKLTIAYRSASKEEETERVVLPLKLFAHGGNWYLVAFCTRAGENRVFRVDRIRSTELLDESFDPAEISDDDGDVGLGPGPGAFELRLRVSKRAAGWLPSYYPVEEIRELPGGEAEITLRAAGVAWAVRLLLRLGPEAELIAPESLRDDVSREAQRILARYQEAGAER